MENNKTVYIKLDRPRELWFGHKAQKMLENVYGMRVEALDTAAMSADVREKVLHVMLQRDADEHGEKLSRSETAELMDLVTPGKALRAIGKALEAAFAPDEEDDDFDEWNKQGQTEDPTGPET